MKTVNSLNEIILRHFTINKVEYIITQHKSTHHVKLLRQDADGGFYTIATTQKSILNFLKKMYKMGGVFEE